MTLACSGSQTNQLLVENYCKTWKCFFVFDGARQENWSATTQIWRWWLWLLLDSCMILTTEAQIISTKSSERITTRFTWLVTDLYLNCYWSYSFCDQVPESSCQATWIFYSWETSLGFWQVLVVRWGISELTISLDGAMLIFNTDVWMFLVVFKHLPKPQQKTNRTCVPSYRYRHYCNWPRLVLQVS